MDLMVDRVDLIQEMVVEPVALEDLVEIGDPEVVQVILEVVEQQVQEETVLVEEEEQEVVQVEQEDLEEDLSMDITELYQ